ncbi:MAG: 16S rRNA (guanine(527)-N(7))-methyltransferase RsmG [Dehalococcoidales bacterium]
MAEPKMQTLIDGAREMGFPLNPAQLEQFAIYYRELLDWNSRINLTAVIDIEEVQKKHFLDSLTLVNLITKKAPRNARVIDVGSGAGFPGIPLKIALPNLEMTLLESTNKKGLFLSDIINKLGLDNTFVVTARAEEMGQNLKLREKFDVVVSRAVANLSALAELTLPFCSVGGFLIAQKKGEITLELEQSLKAIEILGGGLPHIEKIDLSAINDERLLIVIDKIKPTPEKYPRRNGIPQKRPLG